ncbi:alpha/beta fold hydrolase [Actinoalloteichus hymeniacidonis]|uniref:Hydrolase or acyltransferase of alpha/beta superfamily n=1 Tax=Actinoalloteichus hymeniacidonis TaxID=340345 RepID=A0AAC9MXD5_9PSEU|nr:alpha/beta hydrolase [Actinoalloteichus hymeniacidonis]AOS62189.1 putative hydrolase or acyltransferase of alpha/beta superfamily [Actinoalloteichus hymeniacidonis]MBB5909786.1 pimeloyl-ACP methyl ester carboxylesterase [Actinoalloteichus hymeniacidonis]
MNRNRRTSAVIALCCTASVWLAGCGDSSTTESDSAASTGSTTEEGSEQATEDDTTFTGTKQITVEEHSINVSCSGAPVDGRPAVFLLHGGGDDLSMFADVQETLGEQDRVCSYDRPGAGGSDQPAEPQTLEDAGAVLTGVIDQLSGEAPVVLVGHSMGGVIAGRYAPDNQERVAGLVLLDATSPTQGADLAAGIPESATGDAVVVRDQTLAVLEGEGPEQLALPDGEVASAGDIPVEVIQHGVQYLAEGMPEYGEALEGAWTQGQEKWLALSGDSNLSTAEEAGHHIYLDQPDLAVESIRDVVSRAAANG